MPNDVDWHSVANQRAELNKAGVPIARTAHITDQVPEGGHYRYKTSPNMEGNWLIGGGMKVNKVLTDEEVQAINEAAGKADLPRFSQFDKPMGTPEEGMATGGGVPPLEHGMAPQQAHVIDPGMRPPGAPIQHFAAGNAVKKVLEHARTVPFVHFSNHPNISRLEPSAYGSGIKGKEAARLKDAPDIKPRSYFYVKGDNVRPEQGLGAHQYEGVAENIYPLHEDPAGFSAKARDLARDPYFAKMGVEIIDQPKHLNELERQIKNAGYSGYADDNVGLLFNPTDVTKVTD